VHQAWKGSSPNTILFYSILFYSILNVQNSLGFSSNAQHTADLLINTYQCGKRAALKLCMLGAQNIRRGLAITYDIQLH